MLQINAHKPVSAQQLCLQLKVLQMQQLARTLQQDIENMYALLVQQDLTTAGENAKCMQAVHEEIDYIAQIVQNA